MSLFESLTLLVALLGVVVSVVSLVRTRRLDERQQQLSKKQEELTDLQLQLLRREVEEQTRDATPPADVRVSLEGSGRDAKFVVTNWGYGPARTVDFKIKKQEGRSSPLARGDYEEKLPIPELLPGDRVTFIAVLGFDTGTTFDVVLTWTDADGTEQVRNPRVSLT
jgi:hypothetical protein